MENYSKYQIGTKEKVPNISENYSDMRANEEILLTSMQKCVCVLPTQKGKASCPKALS